MNLQQILYSKGAGLWALRISRMLPSGPGFRLADYIEDAERWTEHNRNSQFALAAARMAMDDSGILDVPGLDRARFGIYLGSGEGQHEV